MSSDKSSKQGVFHMIELLSPAGSMEALHAAVQNGADAVYLGSGSFNARAGAKNFTPEQLQEAVSYCHIRGVKVHLTVNTLTTDREQRALEELIRQAAKCGVDAFIVQDPGTVKLCRQMAPTVEVHASTQMGIHNLDGVKAAAEMGCSRAVLARELSRREIAYICKHSPIEIEVFAHGALCMCYSGQCYFSSVIGRRSGNRGQCAQPCRLPYGYERQENKYPLSLKDNCLISYLSELKEMGVASLKIEGRMKRPEYVAIVTRIYRSALSSGYVTAENAAQLERVFSRQGFTQGYYEGKVGQNMLGTRQDLQEDRDLLARARATYESGELSRVGVTFYALVQKGKPAQLAAEDPEGRRCMTEGAVPEAARTRAITAEDLEARLSKTGGTPYFLNQFRAVVDPGLSLSAAEINNMRRDVLTKLSALRGRAPDISLQPVSPPFPASGKSGKPRMIASVLHLEQVTGKLLQAAPAVLYVPLTELSKDPDLALKVPQATELCAVVPRVITDSQQPEIEQCLLALKRHGVGSVLCGNLGHAAMAQRLGLGVRGDFGLNVFSTAALDHWQSQGLRSATISFEATLPQIRDMGKQVPCEILVYGRLPLMLTENCLIKNRTGVCACKSGPMKLTDRMGQQFPVVPDPGTCRSVILNGKKLYLLDRTDDLSRLGLSYLRLQFTTESPTDVDHVLSQWQSSAPFDPASCTRGLYARGVE